jgi:hypothetical protein
MSSRNNRLRPRFVTSVPHAGNQHCLIRTGLSFDGVQVVLLVPTSAEHEPPYYVERFVADFQKMLKRSKLVTLRDCYETTCKELNNG